MNERNQTRTALQRVAVHIVARARVAETGRFSLRVTPGGFGTPEYGANFRRVRVAGTDLVVESDTPGSSAARRTPIGGSTLRTLAAFAEVDLTQPLDVGHDTPAAGDLDQAIELDAVDAAAIASWHGLVAAMLDRVLAELPALVGATVTRLWPEHFDVAFDAATSPGQRVNLGGSPGDGYSDEPYLYVGPFSSERPDDSSFWNAPFGAARTRSELVAVAGEDDLVASGAAFLLDGYRRLA